MKVIYKYKLEITDQNSILMPVGAKVLSIQMQNEQLCMWALVDTNNDNEYRFFYVYGTGNEINDSIDIEKLKFIATVQERFFVWHIFEQ